MKLADRLNSSHLSAQDRDAIDRLNELILAEERPFLKGREGVEIPLPDPIFHLLVRVLRNLREGKSVVLLPESEAFTTQAAANFLGMSRPFLVKLLEKGEIPHHKVGAHRRVLLKDLLSFMERRDKKRRETLDALSDEIAAAGLYESRDTVGHAG